jgi:hypothetical protein
MRLQDFTAKEYEQNERARDLYPFQENRYKYYQHGEG